MKQSQCSILERLLRRKCGVTAREIIEKCGTVAPHKRLSELKERGWLITKQPVPGKNFHVYRGWAPGCWTTKAV